MKNFIIAGPCVLEDYEMAEEIMLFASKVCEKNNFKYIFKASFDKANRSDIHSYRGPSLEQSKSIFKKLRRHNIPITTDFHETWQIEEFHHLVDIIQIPAFLCRQTDLLVAAAKTNKPINIKKGQFASSHHMSLAVEKIKKYSNNEIYLTERGTFFGYNDLVVDFRNIKKMSNMSHGTIIDFTHSCQKYKYNSKTTSGDRTMAKQIAMSGMIWGATGFFGELHPRPAESPSDKSTILDYETFENIINNLRRLKDVQL